jgi:hypothetical protein
LQELRQVTTVRIFNIFWQDFLVNLINHNLYGVEISAFFNFFNFFGDFFENFSILEVEIGINGLGILGVKAQLGHNMFTIPIEVIKSNQWQLRSSLR